MKISVNGYIIHKIYQAGLSLDSIESIKEELYHHKIYHAFTYIDNKRLDFTIWETFSLGSMKLTFSLYDAQKDEYLVYFGSLTELNKAFNSLPNFLEISKK